ncbi:hypothetical protein [Heyndrickxia coagulans]|uniref:Peptidase S74 domain-containing protein n=1 Tax=Heyndrickxia coagulans TaxID=1398 RepID=A0A150KJK2_HEYCO|nr:hypothetical protein [Heyndrickxia coagulans]KYC72287.1 hypothetical protein B4099_3649 [Heyndrickxia coagulans]
MALLGSVDISFTKSTKIAVDATDTAGQAQATAQTASQTATQAAATAADAAQAAQTAITTANGKNKAYYGATTPTSPQSGDIWFVEDSSGDVTAIKHYDGTQWVTDVDNTALAQQISAAQAAADNAATVGQAAQQVAQQAAQVGDSAAKTAAAAQQAANAAQTDAANAVSKNDVINQINVSTEGILIDGRKVHITGKTTIDNAVIKDAMIDSISANKLTAGTIDANVITVKNINASNIVTGTLDASKATVTNIDASKITTGTLNAARIAAGSIDASKLNVESLSALSANLGNVTAGNISGVNIYGGAINQSNSGQNIWMDQNGFHMQSNQLDVWMNGGRGLEILYNNVTQFKVDLNGNLVANDAKLNGNMELNGTFNIPTTMTGDDRAGMHGRYKYTESLSSYVPKVLDGDWFLNSSSLSFRAKTVIQKTKNTYYTTSYYGSGMLKLRAYVDSSNNQYDGNYTNLNNRIDIMPSQITMGQYQPSGDSDWPDEIKISADGSIYASKTIKSGNVYFNGANAIKNDSTVLFLEGNGGIRTNNILINGYHAIKSLDGGEIFLNNGGTGYVDLTVKALHQSSRWELKENFESMDPEVALKNIIDTDVVRYNFKGESEVHVGLVIDDRDNPEYHACSDFITPNRESKKDDTIVGELMLATKALNNYINNHNERLSVIEEQNKNLLLKIADLEARLAKLEV